MTVLMCFLFAAPSFLLRAQCISGNCVSGKGTYAYASGAKYVGEFHKGKINGQGTLFFSNGNRYTGEWVDQFREGEGVLTFSNGNEYHGSFRKSKFSGSGTMTFANGDRYAGSWENDNPNGKGTYLFKDGTRYEGEMKDGAFNGNGTIYYVNKTKYIGEWKNNKRHGKGTYFEANGKTTTGLWANGELTTTDETANTTANTTNTSSNNATKENLKDCNKDYCHDCKGKLTYADGTVYLGDFKDGLPEGQGTVQYANGDRYVGGWANHSPHGDGIMTYKNGRVYGAAWEYGKPLRELANSETGVAAEYIQKDIDKAVKIWAVVVGIGRYNHMPVLKYTDDDAYRYYSFLKSPEGGALPDDQVRVLIDDDASRSNILKAMRQVFLKADENDVVVFYFSGHGLDGSFLPFDYDGYNNKLKHEEIRQVFNETKAKHKICFADACFSGSLWASKAPMDKELARYYSAFETTLGGLALFMSSKSEEYSLEDYGLRSGVFSYFLLKGLKGEADINTNKTITVQELFEYVYRNVRDYTANAQTPTVSGNFDKNMPAAIIR